MATDVTLDKSLPHSPDAERAVLGAILLENELYDQAAELLTEEDFYLEPHRSLFQQMEKLSARSAAIDALTLREELKKENKLEGVGGVGYIASLLDGVPRVGNLLEHARIVKEKSLLRKLIRSSHWILTRSFSDEDDPSDILEQAERVIFEISQERVKSGFENLQDLLAKTYKQIEFLYERKEMVTGVPTGFLDLDRLTSGLQPADLVILAARPGMGKTSLALNIAQHASVRENKSVGIFSLEMSAEQLVRRLLCGEARVDGHRVRTGFLSKEDWRQIGQAMGKLAQARIFIDDTPGITILEMRSKARRLKAEHGLDLLVIDYMQLMSGLGVGRRMAENRQQEISAISRSLKSLAKELNIPVLALSQLSRAPEQRKGDHEPRLSDLRESGSIEQDADVVLFIYRPDLYSRDEDVEESGVAEIIIGKQRNGPTGRIQLAFIHQWTRFENLASVDE